MSGVAASFRQATAVLKLLAETKWTKDEMQRRFFARWGLLRQIAEAVDEIGEEQVRAMHPLFYNKSCDVAGSTLPTEMTVGGRVYEILSFLKEGEVCVRGDVMAERVNETNDHLGEDDCEHLLVHQSEIPTALRGKVFFVFTDWRRPDCLGYVAYLGWGRDGWFQDWFLPSVDWSVCSRFLRRK